MAMLAAKPFRSDGGMNGGLIGALSPSVAGGKQFINAPAVLARVNRGWHVFPARVACGRLSRFDRAVGAELANVS